MQMLYNSDSYVVMQIDVPAPRSDTGPDAPAARGDALTRGGYEIVDKFARKEIFLQGALAERFKQGVQELIESSPSEEEMDDYIERFAELSSQPLVLH